MNYFQARQVDPNSGRPDAGKWRYTCRNDEAIWPVGYCSPIETCPKCEAQFPAQGGCSRCGGQGVVDRENPCPGHDTPEGAYQHQTEYLLTERLRLDGRYSDQQLRCVAPVPTGGVNVSGLLTAPPTGTEPCGKWTDRFAEVGNGPAWPLCNGHRTLEVVAALFGTAGAVMSS